MISSFESKMSRFEELQNATVNTPHNTSLVTTEINPKIMKMRVLWDPVSLGNLGRKKAVPRLAPSGTLFLTLPLLLYMFVFSCHTFSLPLCLSLSLTHSLSPSLSPSYSHRFTRTTPRPRPPPRGAFPTPLSPTRPPRKHTNPTPHPTNALLPSTHP